MAVSYRIPKIKNLQRALRDYPDIARQRLPGLLRDILVLFAGEAAIYPPQPSGSTYIRTGTLGRLWTTATPQINVSASQFEGRIGNRTPYGPNVQGDDDQAPGLRHWRVVSKLVDDRKRDADKLVEATGDQITKDIASRV